MCTVTDTGKTQPREMRRKREMFRHSFPFISSGHPIIQRHKISDHKLSGLSSFLWYEKQTQSGLFAIRDLMASNGRSMSAGDEWGGMSEHFFLLIFLGWVFLGVYDCTHSDMLPLNGWWFIQINNSTRKMIRFKFSVLVHLIWSLYAGPL